MRNDKYFAREDIKSIEELLTLNEEMFTIYKVNDCNLKKKTVEVLTQYILKHYKCKIAVIKIIGRSVFIVFNKKEIDKDLLDLLHDLSWKYVTKDNLE